MYREKVAQTNQTADQLLAAIYKEMRELVLEAELPVFPNEEGLLAWANNNNQPVFNRLKLLLELKKSILALRNK